MVDFSVSVFLGFEAVGFLAGDFEGFFSVFHSLLTSSEFSDSVEILLSTSASTSISFLFSNFLNFEIPSLGVSHHQITFQEIATFKIESM
ncbi:MAG: hypothetical protein LBQ24_05200 [Candidatus Peribacteria bacterium]|nr:hypothetical protein [Candidatus Peribacteria bacterium]